MNLSPLKNWSRAAAFVFAAALLAHATPHGIKTVASTVPANGDVNPYGMAVVPTSSGNLVAGNILVSNFNSSANLQGTGTTIMQIAPDGTVSQFAQINASTLTSPCPGGIGLTTALVALKSGWVIVGSLPTTDGTAATAQAGCLLVLDNMGNVWETFYGSLINGPWDITAWDGGKNVALFVTNVLNGTVAANGKVVHGGTVTRLWLNIMPGSAPSLQSITTVGSGFSERTDPAAMVIGPTGVALNAMADTLYVADSLNNRIVAIDNPLIRPVSAGTGWTMSEGGSLNDPLGVTVGPAGNILTVNGLDGFLTVISPDGHQTGKVLLDGNGNPPGNGALFGLVYLRGTGLYYVDDATNTLNLLH